MPIPTLTTYGGATLAPGFAGQIAEDAPDPAIESRLNEAATAIDFGVAVTRGVAVADGVTPNCKVLNTNGQVPVGITVRNAATQVAVSGGTNVVNYPQYAAVPVMKLGVIHCLPVEDVVEGDGVVALPGNANPGALGGTTAGAANGTSRMAVDGAVWLTTTTVASGLTGKIRIINRV